MAPRSRWAPALSRRRTPRERIAFERPRHCGSRYRSLFGSSTSAVAVSTRPAGDTIPRTEMVRGCARDHSGISRAGLSDILPPAARVRCDERRAVLVLSESDEQTDRIWHCAGMAAIRIGGRDRERAVDARVEITLPRVNDRESLRERTVAQQQHAVRCRARRISGAEVHAAGDRFRERGEVGGVLPRDRSRSSDATITPSTRACRIHARPSRRSRASPSAPSPAVHLTGAECTRRESEERKSSSHEVLVN